jgi:hypothetical protein
MLRTKDSFLLGFSQFHPNFRRRSMLVHPTTTTSPIPFFRPKAIHCLIHSLFRRNRKSYDKHNQEIFKSETMSQDPKGA